MNAPAEWRPIDTAPRDQTLLVYGEAIRWRGNGGVSFGYVHSDYNGHKHGVITLDGRCGPVAKDGEITSWLALPLPPGVWP